MKVYVGTYAKYNNGNLFGKWLNLDNYKNYGEFVEACTKLHKDEKEPEFMIQDTEEAPDGLNPGEWIDENEFNDLKNGNDKKFTIVDYSEKAIAVVGDTKSIKDELKKMGGRFNFRLSCGAGWIFPKSKQDEIKAFLAGNFDTEKNDTEKENNKYIDALREFAKVSRYNYLEKNKIGALKIRDRYFLIDKPSIKNSFCFRDEGAEYEFYQKLLADDKKMKNYFLSSNLKKFTSEINDIKNSEKVYLLDDWDDETRYEVTTNIDRMLCGTRKLTEATDDEIKEILEAFEFGKKCFEKRLNIYLKKYGISKLHTWSYWADA
jgi:hypothetical protein